MQRSIKHAVRIQRRFKWPEWFHDAVSSNRIITHGMGKWFDPESDCFAMVKTPEGAVKAGFEEWVTCDTDDNLGVMATVDLMKAFTIPEGKPKLYIRATEEQVQQYLNDSFDFVLGGHLHYGCDVDDIPAEVLVNGLEQILPNMYFGFVISNDAGGHMYVCSAEVAKAYEEKHYGTTDSI